MVKRFFSMAIFLSIIFILTACNRRIKTVEVTRIVPQTILVPQTVQVSASPQATTNKPGKQAVNTATPSLPIPSFYLGNESLVAYFPFNGNADDASGNDHNGTVHNAQLTEDRFGIPNSAYYFDGLDDYILVNTLNEFGSQLESFTICLWLKTTLNSSHQWRSVIKTINSGENTLLAIELNRDATNYQYQPKMTLFDIRGDGDRNLRGNITTDIYDGQWHYVQWRLISARDNDFEVYVDGIKQTLIMAYQESPRYSDFEFPLAIGAGNNRGLIDGQYLYYGSLDDIAIFDRALSVFELLDLYNYSPSK
jgi:hypothetical protein